MAEIRRYLAVPAANLRGLADDDDAWVGPAPALPKVVDWVRGFSRFGHRAVVEVALAAARTALPAWTEWKATAPELAMESVGEGAPPDVQLDLVAAWLAQGIAGSAEAVIGSVDQTKQLNWFHDEYEDSWFDCPGMWAIEAAECCALAVDAPSGTPAGGLSGTDEAVVAVICCLQSFRRTVEDPPDMGLERLLVGIRSHFQ